MKGYDEYKESGIDWIGKIPITWRTIRIKQLKDSGDTLFIDGDWIESKVIVDEGIRYLTTGNIGPGYYKEQGSGFISEETFHELNCTEVFPGDLVASRLNQPIGRACIIPDLGYRIVVAVDNVIIRPKKPFNTRYIMYLMNDNGFSRYTDLISRGATMQRISRGQLGDITIPFPTGTEQTQIAAFLDHHTGLIDALISKKEALIEKLKQQRQAIINEVVTGKKVWNPATNCWTAPEKTKDSGIEWLGEIPEGWEISKVKWELEFHNNKRVPLESEIRFERQGRFPYYGASGIIDFVDDFIFEGKFILVGEDGANILSRSTPLAFIATGKFWVNNHAHILKSRTGNDEYFCMQLELNDFSNIASGSAQPKLTKDALANVQLVVPSLEEQNEIITYLDYSKEVIDGTCQKITEQIEKLKLYRQSLISEAVTGKIDVREWKPKQVKA